MTDPQAQAAPAKPSALKQLADLFVEYRGHFIVGTAATAITNAVHWLWNYVGQTETAQYWARYVSHLHQCMGSN